MKLQTNNLIIITPVFLILGIVLSLFNYSLEKKELMWGLNEELTSIVTSTSIFVKYEDGINSNLKESVAQSFKRILEFNRVKRIRLYENKKLLLNVADSTLAAYKRQPKSSIIKGIRVSKLYHDKDVTLIDASSVIKDTNLFLVISLDASYVDTQLHHEQIEALVIIISVAFIGIIISFVLSYIVNLKILKLHNMAQDLAKGKYHTSYKSDMVKEFSDLGSTLDIMKSILKEIIFKTHNSIIQDDLTTKEKDLAQLFIGMKERNSLLLNNDILTTIKNCDSSEDIFYNIIEDTEHIFIYYGKVKLAQSALKTAIQVASVTEYINTLFIQKQQIDFEKIMQLYDLETLHTFEITKENSDIKINTYRNNQFEELSSNLNQESNMVYFNSDVENIFSKNLKSYISKFKDISLASLNEDLEKLSDDNDILFLVISKGTSH